MRSSSHPDGQLRKSPLPYVGDEQFGDEHQERISEALSGTLQRVPAKSGFGNFVSSPIQDPFREGEEHGFIFVRPGVATGGSFQSSAADLKTDLNHRFWSYYVSTLSDLLRASLTSLPPAVLAEQLR